jgi:hypothetical protein
MYPTCELYFVLTSTMVMDKQHFGLNGTQRVHTVLLGGESLKATGGCGRVVVAIILSIIVLSVVLIASTVGFLLSFNICDIVTFRDL